ncbi:Oxygen-dependent choline dehydrogenase [Nymphon striatum]|nr:Oxygen-dependent choline dehydrogenase [Nymphon striatum]
MVRRGRHVERPCDYGCPRRRIFLTSFWVLKLMKQAEYVIVGAGSAGCAMAYRLAEAGRKVTVIETGGTDVGPFINMPAALSYPMSMKRYDWGYKSVPEPHLGGRGLSACGAQGWAYADVLPYYKRMEDWHSGGRGGDKNWRGKGGPLHVTRGPGTNRLTRAFIKAGAQAGYELTPDYNGEKQEGFGPFDATIWKGKRWSAASAYLRPAQATGNCELLMLSGIGPAEHLSEHGIDVVADRAGVGQNLQDHLELYVQMAAKGRHSLYKYWSMIAKAWVGARWLFTKSGIGASNQFEAAGFHPI